MDRSRCGHGNEIDFCAKCKENGSKILALCEKDDSGNTITYRDLMLRKKIKEHEAAIAKIRGEA